MQRNRILLAMLLLLLLMAGVASAQQTATPTPAAPSATQVYTVRRGETLNRIAQQYGITVNQLLALNPDITNPNLVYAGQNINVPAPGQPTAPAPAPVTATPLLATPQTDSGAAPADVPANAVLEYGVEIAFSGQFDPLVIDQTAALGVQWIKLEVRWRDMQPNEEDVIAFDSLDGLVRALDAAGLNILLTVTTAPAWARTLDEENGPPDDYAMFATFISAVAEHYAGVVDAYQIWSEPNIRSKWKSPLHPISAAEYLELLRQAYEAVKAADPNALVVSAGLAPTGFNDAYNAQAGNLGVNAVDDRVFLRDLYAAGLADYADAIGAHPMGWANPPDALCCNPAEGVTTHFESPQFYFLNTLQDYRSIMLQFGDGATPIWVTKFGWGTSEDIGQSDPINVFVDYTTLAEQGTYITRAFQIAVGLGYVGPMFLYNLNGCQVQGDFGIESCYYSLLDPNGAPRPAFTLLQSLDKTAPTAVEAPADAAAELTPEAAIEVTAEITAIVTPEATFEVGP